MAEVRKSHLEDIGVRIQKRREALGLKQEDVANILGIRRESYNYIENGKRDLKTNEILLLSDTLGVSCEYLLTGISSENKAVNEELGLSNEAIEKLKTCKNEFPHILVAVNRILSSGQGLEIIVGLFQYLTIDFSKVFIKKRKTNELISNEDFLMYAKTKKGEDLFLPMFGFTKYSQIKEYFLERLKFAIAAWDNDINFGRESKEISFDHFPSYRKIEKQEALDNAEEK